MKTVAIVQARMGSTRFPNKVMQPILGIPMIELLFARLTKSKYIDQIILATSCDPRNQPLVDHVRQLGYDVFQGSENDVLDRYYHAAKEHDSTVVVRITGDCPLIDPQLVDTVIAEFTAKGVDYASNTNPPSFPDGLDTEVFSFEALRIAWEKAKQPAEREHVTPYIRLSGRFRASNIENANDCSGLRWTVDEPCDFNVVQRIYEHFNPRRLWLERGFATPRSEARIV
jgi:glutamate-1-semialdehyde 2,1-aminomutase